MPKINKAIEGFSQRIKSTHLTGFILNANLIDSNRNGHCLRSTTQLQLLLLGWRRLIDARITIDITQWQQITELTTVMIHDTNASKKERKNNET